MPTHKTRNHHDHEPNQNDAIRRREAARPTAAEAADFSAFTQSLPAFMRLTPEEAADLLEVIKGRLCDHATTAAALATLRARQHRLRRAKLELLDTMETAQDAAFEALGCTLAELNRQIAETHQRIAQYILQQKAVN
jgi:hypothetical protein